MAKHSSRSGGSLTSKSRLITIGMAIAGAAILINKLQSTAADATQKGTTMASVAGFLGFKGPAIT